LIKGFKHFLCIISKDYIFYGKAYIYPSLYSIMNILNQISRQEEYAEKMKTCKHYIITRDGKKLNTSRLTNSEGIVMCGKCFKVLEE
jgi:HEPN domain-containing protein